MKNLIKKLDSKALSTTAIEEILPRPFALLDIGARGGLQWPWNQLTESLMNVLLVEPDPDEAVELKKVYSANGRGVVIDSALWSDERTISLHINKSPGSSSVYVPNRKFLDQFPESDRFDLVKTIELSTKTIDNLTSVGVIKTIDFAKIDVQGAELEILKGGIDHFRSNVVGLELEVEFAELYTGQPLFNEVDGFVRDELGLELWDLATTYWKYSKGVSAAGPAKGRLVFGDALYLRPITGLADWLSKLPKNEAGEKVVMVIMSALVYGFTDYVQALLREESIANYFAPGVKDKLSKMMASIGSGFRPFKNGNGYIYTALDAFAKAFQPAHKGWASRGQRGLGSYRGFTWR